MAGPETRGIRETIEVMLIHQTPKAILVKSVMTEEEAWIPKSMVIYEAEYTNLDKYDIFKIEGNHGLFVEKGLV